MRIEDGKIIWDHTDFQDHPDLKCYEIMKGSDLEALNLPVRVETRTGSGYVLPDGDYLFPGDQHITKIVTC